jgi:hypothetical protein
MNNASAKELLTGNKWRLRKSDDLQGFADDVLVRYVAAVKQDDIETLVAFLKKWTDGKNYTDDTSAACATVATPMVHKGKTRSGTWYGGRITCDWAEGENGLPELNLYQVLYKGNVTVSSVETENSCQYNVDTTYYFKVTSLPTCPASDPTLAINYELGGVSRDSETGTYTCWIAKRTRLYQKVAEYTSQIDASETILSTHHRGVKSGDKDDAGADIGLNSVAAAVAGEIREQHRQKNADCSQDIDEVRRQSTDQTATGSGTSDRKLVTAAETTTELRHTAAAAAVADPVPSAGEIKEVVNRTLPYKDRYETVVQTRTVTDQQFARGVVSAAETLAETRHSAAAAAVTNPPVPGAGEIKEVQNNPTPYASRTETVERTRTAIDQTATADGKHDQKEENYDETVVVEEHSQATAALADVAKSEGVVTRVESVPTEFKDRFRTRKTTTTGAMQALEFTFETVNGTATFRRVTNATAAEQAADTLLSGLDATTRNSVSGEMNRLGLRNYSITKSPVESGASTWPEYVGTDTWYYEKRRFRRIFDMPTKAHIDQMRTWTYTVEEKQFVTKHAALAWIAGVNPCEPESGVTQHGQYRFSAKRISMTNDSGWVTDA